MRREPRASMALLACPTASIGSDDKTAMREAIQAFPDVIEDEVHFCGFNARSRAMIPLT